MHYLLTADFIGRTLEAEFDGNLFPIAFIDVCEFIMPDKSLQEAMDTFTQFNFSGRIDYKHDWNRYHKKLMLSVSCYKELCHKLNNENSVMAVRAFNVQEKVFMEFLKSKNNLHTGLKIFTLGSDEDDNRGSGRFNFEF